MIPSYCARARNFEHVHSRREQRDENTLCYELYEGFVRIRLSAAYSEASNSPPVNLEAISESVRRRTNLAGMESPSQCAYKWTLATVYRTRQCGRSCCAARRN